MKIEIDYEDAVLIRAVLAFVGNFNAYNSDEEELRAIRLSTRVGNAFSLLTPDEAAVDAEIEKAAKELGL